MRPAKAVTAALRGLMRGQDWLGSCMRACRKASAPLQPCTPSGCENAALRKVPVKAKLCLSGNLAAIAKELADAAVLKAASPDVFNRSRRVSIRKPLNRESRSRDTCNDDLGY